MNYVTLNIKAANFEFFCCMIQFKESVAQFARENIAPHAAKIDQNNSFPQVCMTVMLINKIEYLWNFDFWFDLILGG